MVRGEQRELDAVRRTDLVEDVGKVPLDGVFADRRHLRDLLIGRSPHDRPNDVELVRGQAERGRATASP